MKAVIASFRRGRQHTYPNHMIIVVDKVDTREKAAKLVGKSVVFKTQSGNEIKGIVKAAHGNKGAVRVIFEKGMPGQSLGKEVELK